MTAGGPKMASRITTVSAWTAHGLTWVPGVWWLFGTILNGTFVESDGLTLVPAFLVPVLLTYMPLATIHLVKPGQAKRKLLLWGPAVVLLVYCGLTLVSFGLAYLPATLVLFVAAVADSWGRATN